VTFPGVTDPLLLRKVDEDHLVTSGEQTVLSIKDNKVEIGIPETTERKTGNPIEAYAILATGFCGGLTTFSTLNDELQRLLSDKKVFYRYFLLTYIGGFLAIFLGILL